MIGLWLLILPLASAPVENDEGPPGPQVGDVCELSAPLMVATRPEGKERPVRRRLKRNERVTLVGIFKRRVQVRVGETYATTRLGLLERRCRWLPPMPPREDEGEVAMACLARTYSHGV